MSSTTRVLLALLLAAVAVLRPVAAAMQICSESIGRTNNIPIQADAGIFKTHNPEGFCVPNTFACTRMVSPSGNAINPQITWSPVAAAKSYVYVHDDPGCPNDPCVHWVIVDIPANVNKIDRDVKNQPPGTPLRNYAGNCPGGPPGNVYRYTVYAMKEAVTDLDGGNLNEQKGNQLREEILSKGVLEEAHFRALFNGENNGANNACPESNTVHDCNFVYGEPEVCSAYACAGADKVSNPDEVARKCVGVNNRPIDCTDDMCCKDKLTVIPPGPTDGNGGNSPPDTCTNYRNKLAQQQLQCQTALQQSPTAGCGSTACSAANCCLGGVVVSAGGSGSQKTVPTLLATAVLALTLLGMAQLR